MEGCSYLSYLPSNFGELTNLQHLSLNDCTALKMLPDSFKKLTLLEHLDLQGCGKLIIKSELHVLENMTKLRYLNLKWCRKLEELRLPEVASLTGLYLAGTSLKELPANIFQLTKLAELVIGSEFLQHFPNSLGNLFSLNRLEIQGCKKLEALSDSLEHLNCLRYLIIKQSGVKCLPKSFIHLQSLVLENTLISELSFGLGSMLKEIHLDGTEVSKISISGDSCPFLQTLCLVSNKYLRDLETLPASLKTIEVYRSNVLKDIRGVRGLKNLRKLVIQICEELDELPSLAEFTSLKEFKLYKCNKLEKIEGLESLRSLEDLNISDCPGLEALSNLSEITSLKEIELYRCHKLRKIEGLQGPRSLETLKISDCPELEKIVGLQGLRSLETVKISHCPELEKIVGLQGLRSLENLEISDCPELDRLSSLEELTSLRIFFLRKCPKLEKIEGVQGTRSLETLEISDCPELDRLPSLEKLTYLRILFLRKCPKLVKIEGVERLRSLEKLEVHSCLNVPRIENLDRLERLESLTVVTNDSSDVEAYINNIQKWPRDVIICSQTRAVFDVGSLKTFFQELPNVSLLHYSDVAQIGGECSDLTRPESSAGANAIVICFIIDCVHPYLNLKIFGNTFRDCVHPYLNLKIFESTFKDSFSTDLGRGKWVWMGVFTQGSSWLRSNGEMIYGWENGYG